LRSQELPEERWSLIHKLNGQLIQALKELLVKEIKWDPRQWVVTVLVLQRTIEETEEAVLKTSSTMLEGEIFDEKELQRGVGNRIVPLVRSFAGYCVRSGNILWVDDIESHPLRPDYRLYEYVNIHPEHRFVAEYVFPIRVKIGSSQTIVGVLNVETSRKDDHEFKRAGSHHVSEIVLRLLDTHGPFLLLTETVMRDRGATRSLLSSHSQMLESTVRDLTRKY
jgi:hypothetical protein